MSRRGWVCALLAAAAILAAPSAASATYLDGYIDCNWQGCSGNNTHFHIAPVAGWNDGCGVEIQAMYNWANGAGIGFYVDDTDPCQAQTVAALCAWGPVSAPLTIAGGYAYSRGRWCSSGSGGGAYVVNADEWYPWGNGQLRWINGWYPTEYPDGVQGSPAWRCDSWGWVTQWSFVWPGYSWGDPNPGQSKRIHQQYCPQLASDGQGHRHYMSNGTSGGGVEMTY